MKDEEIKIFKDKLNKNKNVEINNNNL